ncbi:MAG: FCD domain-containing protein [Parvibaculaceae bacterium]
MSKEPRASTRKRPERAASRVAKEIVSDINERGLGPGAVLDPEHVMIEDYGVARATVREALRYLEMQGALRIKAGPGGGPVVSVPDAAYLTSALSLQLQFAGATRRAVMDARVAIFPVLVGLAAERATHQDIAALRQSLERIQDSVGELEAWALETRRFLEQVAIASKDLVLGLLVDSLHRMYARSGVPFDLKQRVASVRHMGAILANIEKGEATAARVESRKMMNAAASFSEKTSADVLDQPVEWLGID